MIGDARQDPHSRAPAIAFGLAALATLAMVAGCGSVPPTVRVAATALSAGHGPLPAVAGPGVQALWQADWVGSYPVVTNGLVIADSAGDTVAAIRDTTGAPVWTVTLPSSLPDILGLVPAGQVVIVEAGHDVGQAPAAVVPAVTEFVALDQATGRQLWAVPVGGNYQHPVITSTETATGALVLTGDASGTVTALRPATGTVAWRVPAGCPVLGAGDPFGPPVTLAADGSLIAESVSCDPSTVIRRLDPVTGKPGWTWRVPQAAMAGNLTVSVGGAARDGNVILVTGLGDPGESGTTWSAAGLPTPYSWPASFPAPRANEGFSLALDAASGQPRWSEPSDYHFEGYTLTGGAVCGVTTDIQCRDDATGVTTMPDYAPSPRDKAESPGVAGGLALVTSVATPAAGAELTVFSVRGGKVTMRARLAIGSRAYDTGQPSPPVVVAFGALPGGADLVLLNRRDLPDTPTLAVRLETAPAGA